MSQHLVECKSEVPIEFGSRSTPSTTGMTTVGSGSMTESQNIVVQQHSFDSSEARYLVTSLEADLASMYPDWDESILPGMNYENNPQPHRPRSQESSGPDQ